MDSGLRQNDNMRPDIVGHRVVHGGKHFQESVTINQDVKNKIRELSEKKREDFEEFLGIQLNQEKNITNSHEMREINKDSSKVKILVIPTNEELEIAKQAYELMA